MRFPFLFGGTFIEGRQKNLGLALERVYFPSFSEGLSLRGCGLVRAAQPRRRFPFLFGGTFIEGSFQPLDVEGIGFLFPFLFGGTFIEGVIIACLLLSQEHFPSFSEGLSLRESRLRVQPVASPMRFPFLFGGTFIEGRLVTCGRRGCTVFPFLFGGTFIEGLWPSFMVPKNKHFPSFSEGLSLRVEATSAPRYRFRGNFPSFSEGLSLRVDVLQ